MNIAYFSHSLISDWNHGNAHFLRGVVAELQVRGHEVTVYEPRDAWSVANLVQEHGEASIHAFHETYPTLRSMRYELDELDLERELGPCDLVIVHEWNDHDLVRRIGALRREMDTFRLLFHDTHHRAVTRPDQMSAYDLSAYDGVLAYGEAIRRIYVKNGWARQAWTWHEAADTRTFRPMPASEKDGDLVWIGNWGDEERTAELHEFLLRPVMELGIVARVHGVRYPEHALEALARSGIGYGGWLPNYRVPEVFARFKVTVHVPRRPYVESLPGIPTIRPFEALACGIPLVSSPWTDAESLFTPGKDYLVARDGDEMKNHLRVIIHEPDLARELAEHGLRTILKRHTCSHRVDELLSICDELGIKTTTPAAA